MMEFNDFYMLIEDRNYYKEKYEMYFEKYLDSESNVNYWKKGFIELSCLCVGLVVLLFYFMYLLSC